MNNTNFGLVAGNHSLLGDEVSVKLTDAKQHLNSFKYIKHPRS